MQHGVIEQLWQQLKSRSQAAAPRVLFVYAHPDDEIIAVGAHLSLFAQALFLQATDGAPADNADGDRLGLSRDDYRAERALELRAAFAAAGLPQARHRSLNLPDKEAAFHLPALTEQVLAAIQAERADFIFTHPYEGGHADHDACAFAVHQAAAMLPQRPQIVESPFYFESNGDLTTGAFLEEQPESIYTVPLRPEQREDKQAAFACFRTQGTVLALFARAMQQERFRLSPVYDFTRPAVPGPAYYEHFIPHLTPARFCELAAAARSGFSSEVLAA